MSDIIKSKKLGEIEFADEHYVVRFHRDDYPYITATYINPIVVLNNTIEEAMYELLILKREADRNMHYAEDKRFMWTYPYGSTASTHNFCANFNKLEVQLNNAIALRNKKMEEFHNSLIKSWNDQTLGDGKFDPDDLAKADDLVPLVGVAQAAKMITRESLKSWDWFGLGRSEIPAEFDDEGLQDEIGRFFIRTHGSLGSIGESIRLLVVSPDDMATEDIAEVCVANAKSGGQILFRTVLDKKVHHEAGQHFLATSANIYLVSRR